jgi:hypothetical protein
LWRYLCAAPASDKTLYVIACYRAEYEAGRGRHRHDFAPRADERRPDAPATINVHIDSPLLLSAPQKQWVP